MIQYYCQYLDCSLCLHHLSFLLLISGLKAPPYGSQRQSTRIELPPLMLSAKRNRETEYSPIAESGCTWPSTSSPNLNRVTSCSGVTGRHEDVGNQQYRDDKTLLLLSAFLTATQKTHAPLKVSVLSQVLSAVFKRND